MSQRRACYFSINDRAGIIRHSELGAGINSALIEQFAEGSTSIYYPRRRFIYRAGDDASALYIIVRGLIKLCSIEFGTKREAIIDILSPGALFGESALFHPNGVREKSAVAYQSVCLIAIPVKEFRLGMTTHQELYDYTLRLVGERLERAERRVTDFTFDAIPARLDKLLTELAVRYGRKQPDGVLIDLTLPHREIASIIGATRESVTMRLNALRRAGVIDVINRKILIKQPQAIVAESIDATASNATTIKTSDVPVDYLVKHTGGIKAEAV